MLIGVISDTHNYLTGVLDALDFFLSQKVNVIFHCGDWTKPESVKFFAIEAHKRGMKVYGVLGNNDEIFSEEIYKMNSELYNPIEFPKKEKYLIFKYKKVTFGIYHGDDKILLNDMLENHNLQALFLGHSHIPKKEFFKQTQILNPGSIAYSIPFRKKNEEIRTVGIYNTQTRKFDIYEI